MSVKVYVISDSDAVGFLVENDLQGFKDYIAEEDYIDFADPEVFDTETEALAFCAGLGHGSDERATPTTYPLRSFEEVDRPFIEEIEKY